MGISIDQYRACIGTFAARKCSKSENTHSPVVLDHNSEMTDGLSEFLLTPPPHFIGPWKVNMIALITLLMVMLTMQAQANLLIIGGIEPHPGPDTIEKRATVLAELVCKAETQSVKDVLHLYKPNMTHAELENSLKSATADKLIAAIKFLGVPLTEKPKKGIAIEKLIVRVQTLFPDECQICKEDYTVKLGEKPLLSCAICSQGIHPRCLARKTGLAEIDLENKTAEDIVKAINPCGIKTLTYLCGYCHETEIPTPEQNLKQGKVSEKRTVAKPKSVTQIQKRRDDEWTDLDSDNPGVETPPAILTEMQSLVHDSDGSEADNEDEDEDDEDQSTILRRNSRKSPHPKPPDKDSIPNAKPDKADTDAKVCPYYRKGQCRYGIGGKGCPNAHPTLCRRLMSHGTQSPRGCTKGKTCLRFHPKMCSSSVAHMECLNDSCSLYHIKGTRRMNSRPPSADVQRYPKAEKAYNHKPSPRSAGQNPTQKPVPVHEDKEAFLDMLNTWKREIVSAIVMDLKAQGAYRSPMAMAPQQHLPPGVFMAPQQHLPPGHLIPAMNQLPPRGYQILPC